MSEEPDLQSGAIVRSANDPGVADDLCCSRLPDNFIHVFTYNTKLSGKVDGTLASLETIGNRGTVCGG